MLNSSVQSEEDQLERWMTRCFSRHYSLVAQSILWSKVQRKKLNFSL